jgi:hypothetical protein
MQPVNAAYIIREAFDVYRLRASVVVGLAALLQAIQVILTFVALNLFGIEGLLVVSIVNFLINGLTTGSYTMLLIQLRNGETPTIGGVLSATLPRLGSIALVTLIVGICVGVLSIFFVLPGLYLLVRWAVAVPATVADSNSTGGINASKSLTEGRFGPTAVIVLFQVLILFLIPYVADHMGSQLAMEEVIIAQAIVTAIFAPFAALALGELFLQLSGYAPEEIGGNPGPYTPGGPSSFTPGSAYGQPAYGQPAGAYGQPAGAYGGPPVAAYAGPPRPAPYAPALPGTMAAAQPYAGAPSPQAYGAPAAHQPYGVPAAQPPYGAPAAQPPYGAPAPQQAYGAPAAQPPYGAPAAHQPYGAPAAQPPYGAPAPQQEYGAPAAQPPYGAPAPPQAYGAPPQAYGAPPTQPAYGAPTAPQHPYAAPPAYAPPQPPQAYAQRPPAADPQAPAQAYAPPPPAAGQPMAPPPPYLQAPGPRPAEALDRGHSVPPPGLG